MMEQVVLLMGLSGGLIAMVELLLYSTLWPSLFRNLPFRHRPEVPMPDTAEALLRREDTGDTAEATWRYLPAQRALLFRRRFTLGRRPMSMGCILFDAEGRATVRWAPFPLFAFPAMTLITPVLGLVIYDATGALVPAVVPLLLFPAVTAVNWLVSRAHFFGYLLPQVEEAWMERQR